LARFLVFFPLAGAFSTSFLNPPFFFLRRDHFFSLQIGNSAFLFLSRKFRSSCLSSAGIIGVKENQLSFAGSFPGADTPPSPPRLFMGPFSFKAEFFSRKIFFFFPSLSLCALAEGVTPPAALVRLYCASFSSLYSDFTTSVARSLAPFDSVGLFSFSC